MSHLYPLAYRLIHKPEGITPEQLQAEDLGGTDAVILISIIRPDDGSLNTAIFSLEGATGAEVSDDEMFKAWIVMASQLSESKTLGPGKKQFARQTFETVRDIILSHIKAEEQGG